MSTLGEILKAQRTSLGLSLEQAESATRVRGRLLEALENDDLERLPAPGYVKGYVWSYAKYLELDPT
jgi:cytoskeletal protein RodZ